MATGRFIRGTLLFGAGVYVGIYSAQMYSIPKVSDPQEFYEKLKERMNKDKAESMIEAQKWDPMPRSLESKKKPLEQLPRDLYDKTKEAVNKIDFNKVEQKGKEVAGKVKEQVKDYVEQYDTTPLKAESYYERTKKYISSFWPTADPIKPTPHDKPNDKK